MKHKKGGFRCVCPMSYPESKICQQNCEKNRKKYEELMKKYNEKNRLKIKIGKGKKCKCKK